MINVNVNIKHQLTGVLVKKATCGSLVLVTGSVKKMHEIGESLEIDSFACKESASD